MLNIAMSQVNMCFFTGSLTARVYHTNNILCAISKYQNKLYRLFINYIELLVTLLWRYFLIELEMYVYIIYEGSLRGGTALRRPYYT